ncbi:hypothetical protein [Alkaliflexus imshenetskii]|uniref:hypothetical protein n=1 Tax=Alkaliflexus imshenetskii TaxID=286730 RepID=UPI000479C8E5|nr:hypothetical protein [Alkaliflexus imshenetskii]
MNSFSFNPFSANRLPFFICLFLFVIYLYFPVANSSLDAFYYAVSIKDGTNLFLHHHLFYNLFGWYWVKLANLFGEFDVLSALKVMNAFCAFLVLVLLNVFLWQLKVNVANRVFWLLFAGVSWGIMRYATENETYMMPIVASMAASVVLKWFFDTGKIAFIWLAGFLSAFAALIHQIHFFWWFGLLFGVYLHRKSIRISLYYFLPALTVPLIYVLVMVFYYNIPLTVNGFIEFVLHDYYQYEQVNVEFGVINFILTPISFIRTFIQVHGYIPNLFVFNKLFMGFAFFGFILMTVGFILFLIRFRFAQKSLLSPIVFTHILVFAFHFIFAFISHGNAEFMVILPVLLAMILSSLNIQTRVDVFYFAVGMFIWNLSVGILPLNKYPKESEDMVSSHIISQMNCELQPLYVLIDKWTVSGKVQYTTGNKYENIVSGTYIAGSDSVAVMMSIMQALSENRKVFTDCVNQPATLSRRSMVYGATSSFFESFSINVVDSTVSLAGKYYLSQLSLPVSSFSDE